MSSGNEIYDELVKSFTAMMSPAKDVEFALSVDGDIAKLDEAESLNDDPSELEAQLNASTESITNLLGEKCNEPSFNIKDPTLIKQLMQRSWIDTLERVRQFKDQSQPQFDGLRKRAESLFKTFDTVEFPLPSNREFRVDFDTQRFIAKHAPKMEQYDPEVLGKLLLNAVLEEAKEKYRKLVVVQDGINLLDQHVGSAAMFVRAIGTDKKVEENTLHESVVSSLHAFTYGKLDASEYRDAVALNIARTVAAYNESENLNIDVKKIFNIRNFLETFGSMQTDNSGSYYLKLDSVFSGVMPILRTDARLLDDDQLPIEIVERGHKWLYLTMYCPRTEEYETSRELAYSVKEIKPLVFDERQFKNVVSDMGTIFEQLHESIRERFLKLGECIDAVVDAYTGLLTNPERLDRLDYLERRALSYLMAHLLEEVIMPVAEFYMNIYENHLSLVYSLYNLTNPRKDDCEIAG